MMFEKFDKNLPRIKEKDLTNRVTDIYRCLKILNENEVGQYYEVSASAKMLVDLGIIKDLDDFEDFIVWLKKKRDIDHQEFLAKIYCLSHENGNECDVAKFCSKCRTARMEREKETNKPGIVDLFCGAGGMSLGFCQSGFQILFANDIEPSCIETYKLNHPEVDPRDIFLGDIQDFAETVSDYIGERAVEVVIGGPPCQGFSSANKQRVIDDPRNRLYKEFVEVVSAIRPSFFVMENVIGMKEIAHQIIEDFNNIGYDVSYEILNAIDFGVPQNRKRIIFIGNKFNVDNRKIFEKINEENSLVAKSNLFDAIGDLPPLEPLRIKNATHHESDKSGRIISLNENDSISEYVEKINLNRKNRIIYNHKSRYNNDRDIEIFSRLDQGDQSTDSKIADIMPYQSRNNIFKDKYYKLVYNKPSKTITAHMKFDCNMYIHPTQSRGLTPREAARIQSYPDDYYFKGSFTKTYMQIGNSVPPLMAKEIASVVYAEIQKLNNKGSSDQMILNF